MREQVHRTTLHNGLNISIIPRNDFYTTVATLTVKFGSVDINFLDVTRKQYINLPVGTAHFLEHILLESTKKKLLDNLFQHGTKINAYTNFTSTNFTISSISKVTDNIQILLYLIQNSDFTIENIEKERKIIEHEIEMYNDQLDAQALHNLLNMMYNDHPVRNEIAGNISSLHQIQKNHLDEAYNNFYHPNNMFLSIIGPVKKDPILNFIKENQLKINKGIFANIQKNHLSETDYIVQKNKVLHAPITIPKLYIGYKLNLSHLDHHQKFELQILLEVYLELLFGESSSQLIYMVNSNMISNMLNYKIVIDNNFSFVIINAETYKPQEASDYIQHTINFFKKEKINSEKISNCVNKKVGEILNACNSSEWLLKQYIKFHIEQIDFFKIKETLENVTDKKIKENLENVFHINSRSTLVFKS